MRYLQNPTNYLYALIIQIYKNNTNLIWKLNSFNYCVGKYIGMCFDKSNLNLKHFEKEKNFYFYSMKKGKILNDYKYK